MPLNEDMPNSRSDVPEQQADNPWLAAAGMFADDPTWEDFLTAMADYRKQLDEEHEQEIR